MAEMRDKGQFADGWEHDLIPLKSFQVKEASTASNMLEQLSRSSFGGRNLGEAANVLYNMIVDEDCLVIGTFSGAMTAARLGSLLADMIEMKMVDAVVSTGALIGHGLADECGYCWSC